MGQATYGDAARLLRIWERGAGRTSAERALAILAEAEPHVPHERLAALPIASRDRRLLAVRERLFGDRFRAVASCAACGERLELAFEAAQLRRLHEGHEPHDGAEAASAGRIDATEDAAAPRRLQLGQLDLELRAPDSNDLQAAATAPDVPSARSLLARRCVRTANVGGTVVGVEALTDETIAAIANVLEDLAAADTTLDTTCPTCGARTAVPFDVASFLWGEIEAAALRVFHEVHRLARGYGWREEDILALTPLRRRVYLELLPA